MYRLFVVFAVLFLGGVMSQAQVPNTPAGQWLKDYLAVYNRFDPKAYRQFHTERFDPKLLERRGGFEEAVKDSAFLYSAQGKLVLHSVNAYTPTQLEAFAQSTLTKNWVRFELRLDFANPRRALEMGFQVGAAPATSVKPTRVEGDKAFGEALDQHLKKLLQNGLFTGGVLVARNGNPIFQGAYGRRNEAGERLEFWSKFPLASMSKMFTAVAIAQLVEAGKLSYSDPVSKFLPDALKERTKGITIDHLLSHTSGLLDFNFLEIASLNNVKKMLELMKIGPAEFKPGERFLYSNLNYFLLGGVIEQVSGEDYFDYLKRHIFEPLGMNDTGNFALSESTPEFATGFVPDIDNWYNTGKLEWVSNKDTRFAWGNPSGDLTSTTEDLLRFGNALREGKLVKPETLTLMTTQKSQVPYGYGFQLYPGNRIGHNGGAPGQNTMFAFDLKQGYSVIILSNQDRAADVVMPFVFELMGFTINRR